MSLSLSQVNICDLGSEVDSADTTAILGNAAFHDLSLLHEQTSSGGIASCTTISPLPPRHPPERLTIFEEDVCQGNYIPHDAGVRDEDSLGRSTEAANSIVLDNICHAC